MSPDRFGRLLAMSNEYVIIEIWLWTTGVLKLPSTSKGSKTVPLSTQLFTTSSSIKTGKVQGSQKDF